MMRIAVCDDDLKVCSLMEEYVTGICEKLKVKLDFYMYESGTKMCEQMEKGQNFELIFLDIEMEGLNGVETGRYIRGHLHNDAVQIVYISGKENYAMQLFESRPINFLVKPLEYKEIAAMVEYSVRMMNVMSRKFVYRKKQDLYFVDYGKIMYFKSNNRKVQIILEEGEIEFYGKLEKVYSTLPSTGFLYIHKSFIVNIKFVSLFEYDSLTLSNGEILPISQSRRKAIRMAQAELIPGGDK